MMWRVGSSCGQMDLDGHATPIGPRLNLVYVADLDHTNSTVRDGLIDWLNWLHSHVGFEGWRFDFVKVRLPRGWEGRHTQLWGRWAGCMVAAPCSPRVLPAPHCLILSLESRLRSPRLSVSFDQGYHPRFTAEYIERTVGPEAFCVGENFVDLRW